MGLGSEIGDPEKTYPGSRGQKDTGSWIRIRNTAFLYMIIRIRNTAFLYMIFFLKKRSLIDTVV